MKTIHKILFLFLFIITISDARTGGELKNFYKNLDFDFFFDKIEVTFDICKCEIEDLDQWAAGLKSTIVEPIGIIESSLTPWHFIGLDYKADKSLDRKQGTSRSDGNFRHAHFIIFPVLGYTLGMVQDFFCFERANVLIWLI
jgi:hypothetical protein